MARPIVFDAAVAELAFDAAVVEEAAVAAEASGSSAAGGAEEPLLSDNVAEGSQPDVADVPLPSMSKRMRAEVSEKTVGDPLEWHCIGKRQKTESSAVADKESSAVADGVARKGGQVVNKGRTLGVQVVDCMFLVKRREDVDEEESSQNTTMQFGSPAKGRYVCPHGAECEDFGCPSEDFGLLREADGHDAREYKTLHAKVGNGKGKGRSGGRAAPKKDRKANNKEKGKEAEPCTVDWLRGGSGAYLRWIAQKARQEKALSELFAKLAEEDRAWQNGSNKEKGKHIEELKSKVKEARETVLNRRWAHGVVNKIKQCRSCGRYVLEGKGKGSRVREAWCHLCQDAAHRRSCGEADDRRGPVWGIAARARMVDIPLEERHGVRAEIGPPRTPEEWHRRTPGGALIHGHGYV